MDATGDRKARGGSPPARVQDPDEFPELTREPKKVPPMAAQTPPASVSPVPQVRDAPAAAASEPETGGDPTAAPGDQHSDPGATAGHQRDDPATASGGPHDDPTVAAGYPHGYPAAAAAYGYPDDTTGYQRNEAYGYPAAYAFPDAAGCAPEELQKFFENPFVQHLLATAYAATVSAAAEQQKIAGLEQWALDVNGQLGNAMQVIAELKRQNESLKSYIPLPPTVVEALEKHPDICSFCRAYQNYKPGAEFFCGACVKNIRAKHRCGTSGCDNPVYVDSLCNVARYCSDCHQGGGGSGSGGGSGKCRKKSCPHPSQNSSGLCDNCHVQHAQRSAAGRAGFPLHPPTRRDRKKNH